MILNKKIMFLHVRMLTLFKQVTKSDLCCQHIGYHQIPFVDLYEKTTGETVCQDRLNIIKKRHPNIDTRSFNQLQSTLEILSKFQINAQEACRDPHIFCMNPISMDNYGEILRECGFVKIIPKHIIRYHTLVKSKTVKQLKKEGLIGYHIKLEENLIQYFHEWPDSHKDFKHFDEGSTSILTIRTYILERFLNWKLHVTPEEFQKYCRNYLPLRHRPMADIQESIHIAQNQIMFDSSTIRRNGFLISADPLNTKLIIENVPSIAGLEIREVIRVEPAILKNNYNSLIEIRKILEDYGIPDEAQRNCLKVFCMCPETVQERLEELKSLKEYQVLATNPRVLSMVVHKKKMISRLDKIQAANKQCYSLNHLVSSSKVFNNYINSFGNKTCSRDIAILISTTLRVNKGTNEVCKTELVKSVVTQLKRHKFCLHTALSVIDANIKFLQRWFDDEVIYHNCQLLLYPLPEIEYYLNFLRSMRNVTTRDSSSIPLDASYNSVEYSRLSDHELLALVLYEIEKKYHFSGDGIWSKQDSKLESHVSS